MVNFKFKFNQPKDGEVKFKDYSKNYRNINFFLSSENIGSKQNSKHHSYLNNFLGRFDFRHFSGVSLDDVQNPVSVSVDEMSSPSSVDDLVFPFARVDGVPDVVLSNVLNVDRSRFLFVRDFVVVLLLERPRSASEAGRCVGSDSFVEAAEIFIC